LGFTATQASAPTTTTTAPAQKAEFQP
jgi:hypothetical protein